MGFSVRVRNRRRRQFEREQFLADQRRAQVAAKLRGENPAQLKLIPDELDKSVKR